jgi:hypothetical protein
MNEDYFTFPDEIEPYVGYRVWSVLLPELLLASPLHLTPWKPRTAAMFHCRQDENHLAPTPNCGCGFYGTTNAEQVYQYLRVRNPQDELMRVIGEVSLWGKVVPGTKGYRGEFAYPKRIWVHPHFKSRRYSQEDVAMRIVETYGTPVELTDSYLATFGSTKETEGMHKLWTVQ